MAGCRGGSPRLGAPSPRLACIVLGSSLRISAVSGGKSTMRNAVPPRGGMMPMSIAARSLPPPRSAGVSPVTHSRRDTVCACGRTFLCGLAPSISTTALSFLSMVVTTRRTSALKGMTAFPPVFENCSGRCTLSLPGSTRQALHRLGVDQHGGEVGGLLAAVAPGVIGAALNEDVARAQQDLALIHQRVNLAGEHDGVIDRGGLVEAGMARRGAIEGGAVAGAVVRAGTLRLERGEALLVGRILDDAGDRAVPRRREPERVVGDLGPAAVVGRGRSRFPELGHDRAARAAAVDVRRRTVHHEYGSAGGVMAGHHAADRLAG